MTALADAAAAPPIVLRSPEVSAPAENRLSIVADLRGALANDELRLQYQPIIDAKKHRLAAVEALLRWHSPNHGTVPPDQFVPWAADLGMLDKLTYWVLDRAGRELGPLMERHPELRLSINLPADEVSPERVQTLLSCLAACGTFGPDRLQVEITERTLLTESPTVTETLAALAQVGVSVAVDDFGTGYTSLSYLDRFPINCLKIDKSFINRLATSPRSRKLTEAIVLMAGALGVQAVAEGVETIEQLAFLVGKGCRYVQGYLFARPLEIAPLEAFFANFHFPEELLEAALWPEGLGLPRLLADNQEQALRLFVEHVPAAVAMFDPDMRYLVASARWIRDNRLVSQNLVGRCHYEILPATASRWREIYARCLAGAVERSEEDSYIAADGKVEWLRWEVRPFTNGIGDVAGIIVFNELITERKEAENRQRESEQRLADYLATASDWLWETDAEHRFLSVTHVGDPVCWPGDGDVGRQRWELAGNEPGQDTLWLVHQADLKAHRPFYNLTFARRTAAEQLTWREVSGRPVFDADGVFRGYRGTARDITARKIAESALRAQTAQLELAGEMARLGNWHLDLVGRHLTWSQAASLITGRDAASFGGDFDSRYEMFHPEDRKAIRDTARVAVAACQPYQTTGRVVRPDGTLREVVLKARPELGADNQLLGYFGIIQDITGRTEAASELARISRENLIFRAIFEALPAEVFADSAAGRALFANVATFRRSGLSKAEHQIGKNDQDSRSTELVVSGRSDEKDLK